MRLVLEIPSVGWDDTLVRLAIAAGLGSLIGLERELDEKAAGLRTHMLVAVGSALFTMVGAYGFHGFLAGGEAVIRADPGRIAAQIVTGIGFLGAGAIIRQGLSVRGLTTAATLWVVAAIGMASGAGYYSGAVVVTGVVLFALWPLRFVARPFFERPHRRRIAIELGAQRRAAPVLSALEELGVDVRSFSLDKEGRTTRLDVLAELPHGARDEEILLRLGELDEVAGVRWS